MNMKKFILRFLLICSPLIALYAYPMLRYAHGDSLGDLSQLGSYFFDRNYISVMAHDPGFKRHVVLAEDITKEANDSDVLVIGDSFTQIGYNNFMEYLQDLYPAHTVYGIHTFRYGEEWHYAHRSLEGSNRLLRFPGKTDLVLYLLQHAKRLPSTIVIESSEMWLMETIMGTTFTACEDSLNDYDGTPLPSSLEKYDRYNQLLIRPNPVECLFNGRAFGFAQDWIKRRTGVAENNVETAALSRPMFSCKGHENMLYYLSYNMTWTDAQIEKMRSTMTQIIEEGKAHGVNIIFMIIPMKEHLYKDFILSGTPQATLLTEYLTDRATDPHYLLCLPILNEMIRQGEKDVFLASDTHWSYKGAQACAQALQSKIKSAEQ